jgi:hypothetical protein
MADRHGSQGGREELSQVVAEEEAATSCREGTASEAV